MKKHLLQFLCILLLLGSTAYAQNKTVTGTVISTDDKQPLAGVTVVIKGTRLGTQTNINGKFTISVPEGKTLLTFSFIGFITQDFPIKSNNFTVNLSPTASQLNEVVIVGYGTQERRDLTGAVGKVTGAEIADLPAPSFDKELAGRVTGVQVTENSGFLGAAPVIHIRGTNSVSSGNSPLYVLDGVPIITGNQSGVTPNNPLGDINPEDIASVEVLKDGSATAIYGSRASGGAVLITTKKGKAGKTNVNYDMWLGSTTPSKRLSLLDADQFIQISNEKFANAGIAPQAFPTLDPSGKPYNTNWEDVVFRRGFQQNHAISLSGGSQSSNYYFSGGYSNLTGDITDNSQTKYTFRANVEQKAIDIFTFGFNAGIANTANYGANTGTNALSGNVTSALLLFPNVPIMNPNGSYNFSSDGAKIGQGANLRQIDNNYVNIKYVLDNNIFRNQNTTINGTSFADAKIFDGLHLRTQVGINAMYGEDFEYLNPTHGDGKSSNGLVLQQYIPNFNYVWTNTLNYNKTFGDHNFGFVAGAEFQHTRYRSFYAEGTGLSNVYFGPNNIISNTLSTQYSGGDEAESSIKSYFARLNYNFKERYLITLTYRTDYLSSLGPNSAPGKFPGISAGWRISNEDFFKSAGALSFVNDLKIRVSAARTGNSNIPGGNYPFASSYAPYTYGTQSGIAFSNLGNPNLRYETTDKYDLGLDLTTLKNRLSFTLDVYKNNDNGLIQSVPIAPSLGVPNNTIQENVGNMYNKGIEVAISSRNIVSKNFNWSTDFNFSYNANKITKLYSGLDMISTYNYNHVGSPIGEFYGFRYAGVNSANGNPLYYKANGQEIQGNLSNSTYYVYNPANPTAMTTQSSLSTTDKVALGNSAPTYFGGFNNSFTYRGFDLNLYFTYSGGNKVYDATRQEDLDNQYFNNNGTEILQRWTTPGQVTSVPKLYYGDNNFENLAGGTTASSRYIEDGKFIRLQEARLGYSLPLSVISHAKMSRLHIYVAIQNAFIITKYKGLDPEVYNTGTGVDYNANPRPRTLVAGLNVGF